MGILKSKKTSYLILTLLINGACLQFPLKDFKFYELKSHDRLKVNGLYSTLISKECNKNWKELNQINDGVKWYLFFDNGYFFSVNISHPNIADSLESIINSFIKKSGNLSNV